ncbi:MAG: hypothetical protein ACT4QF_03705 [Sporichthyaceae bacterium]
MMRRRAALTVALALAAPTTWFAPTAQACSCHVSDIEHGLREGWTLALVTRTDLNFYGGERETFRIERSVGPDLGVGGEVHIESNNVCAFDTLPLQTSPLYLRREGKRILAEGCANFDTGPALDRVLGAPSATSREAPVAVIAGQYGGSRLATVDERGGVVAWDRRPGYVGAVAVCPGGRTLVASAYIPHDPFDLNSPFTTGESYGRSEVTVHDAATLRLVRTLALPADLSVGDAMRCLDPEGTSAQVLGGTGYDGRGGSALYTLTERATRRVPIAQGLVGAVADSRGFFAQTAGDGPEASLIRVSAGGQASTLHQRFPRLGQIVLSPDGRTLAALVAERYGALEEEGADAPTPPGTVVTLDARTGAVLAWASPTGAQARPSPAGLPTGLAWTAAGELLVATSGGDEGRSVEVLDRGLRTLGIRPITPGSPGFLASIGDSAALFSRARLTLTGPDRTPRSVDNLWLVGATYVTPLRGPEFDGRSTSTDDQLPWVLAGLGLVVVGLGVAGLRSREA